MPAVDGIALAMTGETASGDAWRQVSEGDTTTILLADGLGHGDNAAAAANAAVRELVTGLDPERLLARLHGALRPTRGAAAAIAQFNRSTGALRYAGIGNIAGVIVDGGGLALARLDARHPWARDAPGARRSTTSCRPAACSSCTPTACAAAGTSRPIPASAAATRW